MSMIYREMDGDTSVLEGRQVSVVGYGNLGRSFALNLRDSGIEVIISERDSQRQELARQEGFTVLPADKAASQASIIVLLVPDELMPQIYLEQISPNLQRGHSLVFGSAYNVTFGYIEAPPFVDVLLIAPRTLGVAVRERYLSGVGFLSFISVGQDASGKSWDTLLGLARAVGTLRAGAIEVAFEQEAELDLFIQQAALPAFHHIILTAAQLLLERGYPPEAVFTELYLSGELSDYLFYATQAGLMSAVRMASLTGQYGTFSRLDRFSDLKLQRLMETTLDDIADGSFAKEWAKEYSDGYNRLRKLIRQQQSLDLWELEQQTIELLRPDDEL